MDVSASKLQSFILDEIYTAQLVQSQQLQLVFDPNNNSSTMVNAVFLLLSFQPEVSTLA
jgi:hypothetical protein